MTVNITTRVLDALHDIAVRAGREIMDVYVTDFDVAHKGDASPVTEADRRAEALILDAIRAEITDTFPIIGEESFSDGKAPTLDGGPFWLVDPLDGTKEFVSRNGEFTVNIALVDGGVPVVGVVYAPVLNNLFMGSPFGATADFGSGPQMIKCRKWPAEGLTALVSRSHKTPETDDFLKDYTIKDETSAGSSLKFCLVARGLADIYPRLGRTMEWDTAAGHAVLRAAGGDVTKLDGAPLSYGKPGFENPHFVAFGKRPA
ncbi:MAG: 3'(2'),5'-bisphosphate nucleotidase CysQ [Alphaproteobacteria bacterium]|nr:3'(2'),5'-bisphosphate nucleotidase CysQ [Alphaproteobacteria bacterium]MBF0249123.1 3'(2'),5'-bisphosphate nucleotidase CysQ [Alphaproteobacteria bacterium]